MTPIKFFLLFTWLALTAVYVEAQEPKSAFVKVSLSPEQGVAGQQRLLQVHIYTRYWFKRVPNMPHVKLPGAVVIQPKGFGVNYTEQVDGVHYNVQTQEYQIYPRRQGAFIIPRLEIGFAVQAGNKVEELRLYTQELGFVAKSLPGSELLEVPSSARLVAKNLNIEQSFPVAETEQGLRINSGDILNREISLSAESTLSMLIDPFSKLDLERDKQGQLYQKIKGGRLYRQVLAVKDSNNRGKQVSSRIERWRYVFSQPGMYELPGVEIPWFDIETEQWQLASVDGYRLEVLASPEQRRQASWYRALAAAVLLALLLLLVNTNKRYPLIPLIRRGRAWWLARKPEEQHWRALQQACKQGNRDALIKHFYRWRQCYTEADGAFASADKKAENRWSDDWQSLFAAPSPSSIDYVLLKLQLEQYRAYLKKQRSLKGLASNPIKKDKQPCLAELYPP